MKIISVPITVNNLNDLGNWFENKFGSRSLSDTELLVDACTGLGEFFRHWSIFIEPKPYLKRYNGMRIRYKNVGKLKFIEKRISDLKREFPNDEISFKRGKNHIVIERLVTQETIKI